MTRARISQLSMVVLSVALCGPVGRAEADWFPHHHARPHYGPIVAMLPSGSLSIIVGGAPYHYYRGTYYHHGPRGYVTVPAPVGAVVTTLPDEQQTIIIDGLTYHYYDGVYYKGGPAGYTVVPVYQSAPGAAPPVAVSAAPSAAAATGPSTLVVNVQNKNGSYTPVTLQLASGGMYIGPQGEVYPNRPDMAQLQAMYGK